MAERKPKRRIFDFVAPVGSTPDQLIKDEKQKQRDARRRELRNRRDISYAFKIMGGLTDQLSDGGTMDQAYISSKQGKLPRPRSRQSLHEELNSAAKKLIQAGFNSKEIATQILEDQQGSQGIASRQLDPKGEARFQSAVDDLVTIVAGIIADND